MIFGVVFHSPYDHAGRYRTPRRPARRGQGCTIFSSIARLNLALLWNGTRAERIISLTRRGCALWSHPPGALNCRALPFFLLVTGTPDALEKDREFAVICDHNAAFGRYRQPRRYS